jgi:hypothetical protein
LYETSPRVRPTDMRAASEGEHTRTDHTNACAAASVTSMTPSARNERAMTNEQAPLMLFLKASASSQNLSRGCGWDRNNVRISPDIRALSTLCACRGAHSAAVSMADAARVHTWLHCDALTRGAAATGSSRRACVARVATNRTSRRFRLHPCPSFRGRPGSTCPRTRKHEKRSSSEALSFQ